LSITLMSGQQNKYINNDAKKITEGDKHTFLILSCCD
jgi:hypothetical protein